MIKLRIRTARFLVFAACFGVATQASAAAFFYLSNNVLFDDGARAFGQIGVDVDADQYVGSQINILLGSSLVFQASDQTNDQPNAPSNLYDWTNVVLPGPPAVEDVLSFIFAKPLDLPACTGAITATCIGNGEQIKILAGSFYAHNSLLGAPQHFFVPNASAFVTAVNVPEPSALALLGIATAGLAFARRRRTA